jgi:hypothetical protein
MAKANKRPVSRRRDTRSFIGTCSNCRAKRIEVTKVKNAQVCMAKCLMGVISPGSEI